MTRAPALRLTSQAPTLFSAPSFPLGFFLTFQTRPPRWTPAARRKRVIGLCAKLHLLLLCSVQKAVGSNDERQLGQPAAAAAAVLLSCRAAVAVAAWQCTSRRSEGCGQIVTRCKHATNSQRILQLRRRRRAPPLGSVYESLGRRGAK